MNDCFGEMSYKNNVLPEGLCGMFVALLTAGTPSASIRYINPYWLLLAMQGLFGNSGMMVKKTSGIWRKNTPVQRCALYFLMAGRTHE
jgi:hypothetical protein